MPFYICSIITGVLLTITFIAYLFRWGQQDWQLWLTGTIILSFLEFGMVVPLNCDHYKVYPVKTNDFTFSKTASTVTIELPDHYTETFKDALTYNKIDNASGVFDIREINFYGFEIKRSISVERYK